MRCDDAMRSDTVQYDTIRYDTKIEKCHDPIDINLRKSLLFHVDEPLVATIKHIIMEHRIITTQTRPHRDILCVKEELRIDSNGANEKAPFHDNQSYYRQGSSEVDEDFKIAFDPSQMRLLALVSHDKMKPTMQAFVQNNKNVLKKFRLTGTKTTMEILKRVFGNHNSMIFGPTYSSGPLGGDAELVALMCAGELGGFQDPMGVHPHQADIDCLCRQATVHNIMIASNPTSALMMMTTLHIALTNNMPELMPSFFSSLQIPTVGSYIRSRTPSILEALNSNKQPAEEFEEEAKISNTIGQVSTHASKMRDTPPSKIRQLKKNTQIDDESVTTVVSRASRRRTDADKRLLHGHDDSSDLSRSSRHRLKSIIISTSLHSSNHSHTSSTSYSSRSGHRSYMEDTVLSSRRRADRTKNRPTKVVTRRAPYY